MTQTLEPRIYSRPSFNLEEIAYFRAAGHISEEKARISHAYFGRETVLSTPDPDGEIGLNLTLDNPNFKVKGGNIFKVKGGSIRYQSVSDITGLMNDLDVDTPQQMEGKEVMVYMLESTLTGISLLIGLSALPKK